MALYFCCFVSVLPECRIPRWMWIVIVVEEYVISPISSTCWWLDQFRKFDHHFNSVNPSIHQCMDGSIIDHHTHLMFYGYLQIGKEEAFTNHWSALIFNGTTASAHSTKLTLSKAVTVNPNFIIQHLWGLNNLSTRAPCDLDCILWIL